MTTRHPLDNPAQPDTPHDEAVFARAWRREREGPSLTLAFDEEDRSVPPPALYVPQPARLPAPGFGETQHDADLRLRRVVRLLPRCCDGGSPADPALAATHGEAVAAAATPLALLDTHADVGEGRVTPADLGHLGLRGLEALQYDPRRFDVWVTLPDGADALLDGPPRFPFVQCLADYGAAGGRFRAITILRRARAARDFDGGDDAAAAVQSSAVTTTSTTSALMARPANADAMAKPTTGVAAAAAASSAAAAAARRQRGWRMSRRRGVAACAACVLCLCCVLIGALLARSGSSTSSSDGDDDGGGSDS